MIESVLNAVGGARWMLPVRTPQDRTTENQMEGLSTDASHDLVRDVPLEAQRRAAYDLPNGSDGDNMPAISISAGEVEGRAAVAAARRPDRG